MVKAPVCNLVFLVFPNSTPPHLISISQLVSLEHVRFFNKFFVIFTLFVS